MNSKRFLQLAVSLVVGGVCMYLAFREVNVKEALGHLVVVPWYGHLAYLVALIAQFVVRTERWRLQTAGISGTTPPARDSLAINAVSSAAVFLFPFRLGELVRPVLTAQRGYMSAPAGLAATALERILDGMLTTGLFGLVLLWMGDKQQLPPYVAFGGFSALAIFGGALIVLVAAFRWREPSVRFWERAIGLVHGGLAKRLVGMLAAFLEGLACFRTPGALGAYLGLSLVYWLLNGASMWLLLYFMSIHVPPVAAFFTLCFLVIGVMLPAPPGNVGNFHAFAKAGLVVFGVSQEEAMAYAVLLHGWQVVGLVLWAGCFLLAGDVSFRRVREATSSDASKGATP